MSITATPPPTPAVTRLPQTADDGSAGGRQLALIPLTDLTGNTSKVTICARSDHSIVVAAERETP